jgi:undecaprenyl-diphosphatase
MATALVLLGFFWADWVRIGKGMWRSLVEREIAADNPHGRLGWLLVVGTIPAGLLGLLLEHALRDFFASGRSASFFLILNGLVLYGAERLRRRAPEAVKEEDDGDVRVAETASYTDAAAIGTAQALALIPGFSRTGVTIGGGLLVGLTHEDAARFSFLLATPIIGAAAVLKLPDLAGSTGDGVRGQALVASLCAALTAYLSVRLLMRYFETNKLTPFAVYCVAAGLFSSIYLGWIK